MSPGGQNRVSLDTELRWNKYLVEAGFSRLAVITPGFAPVCNPAVTPEKRHVVTVSHPFQQNVTRTFVAAHTRKACNVLRHGRPWIATAHH